MERARVSGFGYLFLYFSLLYFSLLYNCLLFICCLFFFFRLF